MIRLKRTASTYFLDCPTVGVARLRGALDFQLQQGVKKARRVFFYMIAKLWHFTFNERTYRYFYHPYGRTWENERAVEVPIIWREIKKHEAQRILEVGNVLSHYYPVQHDVVDKYEKAPGVTNVDIRNFDTSKDYDLIASISTIEHVAYDDLSLKERENIDSESLEEAVRVAIENLKRHVSNGGKIVITVPLGYNPAFDRLLKEENIFSNIRYLKRISKNNIWREANNSEIHNVRYDWPFIRGNGVAVCVYQHIPK